MLLPAIIFAFFLLLREDKFNAQAKIVASFCYISLILHGIFDSVLDVFSPWYAACLPHVWGFTGLKLNINRILETNVFRLYFIDKFIATPNIIT